jgi:hypothetical protein
VFDCSPSSLLPPAAASPPLSPPARALCCKRDLARRSFSECERGRETQAQLFCHAVPTHTNYRRAASRRPDGAAFSASALGRRHWTELPLLPCSSSKCHSRCAHEWSRASLSRRHLRRYTNLCVAVNSWLPALFVGFRLDIRTSINHFPSAEIFFTKVKERRVIICLVLIDIASVDYSLSFST